MLEDIKALPGSQGQFFPDERNRQTGPGQRGSDMRCHVVRTFGCVAVAFAVLRDELFEEVAHIERHIGIGILLNDQRAGGVLDKGGEEAVISWLFREPFLHHRGKRIETLALGHHSNRRVCNQQN